MKSTGIIRRIDDLGRVVIPNDIRRTAGIKVGDPLEIFVEGGMVTFKKYKVGINVEEAEQFVASHAQYIANVIPVNGICTTVIFTDKQVVTVQRNPKEPYSLAVAIVFAFLRAYENSNRFSFPEWVTN